MTNLDSIITEMYEEVMYQIENNLFEERLSSKESFRRAIALWKNLPEGKKESEAKRILKASKREGYIVKQKDILKYADSIVDYGKIKAKKAVRKDIRSKKKAKREERFEKIKSTVEDKDLEDKTRIELLALATKKGLKDNLYKMNREELLKLLKPKKEVLDSYEKKLKEHKEKYKDELNFIDEFGKKQGLFRQYYDARNKKIETEAYFIDGVLNGELTKYDEDGKIYYLRTYKNGELEGKIIEYYKGEISTNGYFKDGEFFESLPEVDESERKEVESKLLNGELTKTGYIENNLRDKFGFYGDNNFKINFPKYVNKVYSNYLKIGTTWESDEGTKVIKDIELNPTGDLYLIGFKDENNKGIYSIKVDGISKKIEQDKFSVTSEGIKQKQEEERIYKEREERQKQQEERQKQYEKEMKEKKEELKNRLSGYLKGKSEIQKGLLLNRFLEKVTDGETKKTYDNIDWLEDLMKRGYFPEENEYTKADSLTRRQYNRLNMQQQYEAENKKIIKYVMRNNDKGRSYDINKTQFDLAKWLKNKS